MWDLEPRNFSKTPSRNSLLLNSPVLRITDSHSFQLLLQSLSQSRAHLANMPTPIKPRMIPCSLTTATRLLPYACPQQKVVALVPVQTVLRREHKCVLVDRYSGDGGVEQALET